MTSTIEPGDCFLWRHTRHFEDGEEVSRLVVPWSTFTFEPPSLLSGGRLGRFQIPAIWFSSPGNVERTMKNGFKVAITDDKEAVKRGLIAASRTGNNGRMTARRKALVDRLMGRGNSKLLAIDRVPYNSLSAEKKINYQSFEKADSEWDAIDKAAESRNDLKSFISADSKFLYITMRPFQLEQIYRRMNEVINEQRRWKPEDGMHFLAWGSAQEDGSLVVPSMKVQMTPTYGNQKAPQDSMAELSVLVGGFNYADKRRIAPYYNFAYDMLCYLNGMFPEKLNDVELPAVLVALLISYCGTDTSKAVDGAKREIDFESMATKCLPYLGLPWSMAYDDMDPASMDVEFWEALLLFNMSLAMLADHTAVHLAEGDIIYNGKKKQDLVLQELMLNQKPDISLGAGQSNYFIPYQQVVRRKGVSRRLCFLTDEDVNQSIGGQRTKSMNIQWGGIRDTRGVGDAITLNFDHGRPDQMVDSDHFNYRTTVSREAYVQEIKREFATFNRLLIPRPRFAKGPTYDMALRAPNNMKINARGFFFSYISDCKVLGSESGMITDAFDYVAPDRNQDLIASKMSGGEVQLSDKIPGAKDVPAVDKQSVTDKDAKEAGYPNMLQDVEEGGN